jgi:hypothetical protein
MGNYCSKLFYCTGSFEKKRVELTNQPSDLPGAYRDNTRKFDFILSTLATDFDFDMYLKMLKPQEKFCLVASPLKKL